MLCVWASSGFYIEVDETGKKYYSFNIGPRGFFNTAELSDLVHFFAYQERFESNDAQVSGSSFKF